MQRFSIKLNFNKLRKLYQHELQEYILFNRHATLKSLFFATPLLLISIALLTFSPVERHIVPWHVISGIASLYFVVKAIIYQVNSFGASKRKNAEVDLYLKKIQHSSSTSYQVSDEVIECYIDDKLEYITKWTELYAVVEKEGYFCLFFYHSKIMLVPEYAVQTEFYKEFLNHAKKVLGVLMPKQLSET